MILGAGGHAIACIDVLESEKKYKIFGLIGAVGEVGKRVSGYRVIGTDLNVPSLLRYCTNLLVGVGQIKTPEIRRRLYQQGAFLGCKFPVVISPLAYISSNSNIGQGTIVMHGSIVQAGVTVGENCILNSRCLIEHGAKIGNHSHISTGVIVNGDVEVGEGTFVGSGAVLQEGVRLRNNSVVPMGKIVRRQR